MNVALKTAAQRGLARQNQELAKRAQLLQAKKSWQANWVKLAKINVMKLAAEEKAKQRSINPAWAAKTPASGDAKATIQTKHGVAGENFQAPSAPGPVVTAVDGPYDSLSPKQGSAVHTFVESLVEEKVPLIHTSAPKAQTVARVEAVKEDSMPWGMIGLGLGAFLLLRKKR